MPFGYHQGRLHCEGVALEEIAAAAGTPVYVYSAGAMRSRLHALQRAFAGQRAMFCYALKANHNLAVVRLLAGEGAGADTVSGGEVMRALKAGVPPERIVLAGVAKADEEIRLALASGILQLNVESVPELRRISAIAQAMGTTASVAIRVNPDVAAATHDKISTGRKQDKFGIAYETAPEIYALAASLPGVRPEGLHMHIGSQITTLEPFEKAYGRGVALFRTLREQGLPMRRLDLGGGFGVRYLHESAIDPEALAALVGRLTAGLDCELLFEPGRYLVAEAGVLVAAVIYVKEAQDRRFVILDAGMNTLMRPALYGARHDLLPLREAPAGTHLQPADVVGPICESSDVFGRDYHLPPMAPGALVAFTTAGAYGAVMASDYNSRPAPAEVLVDGGRFDVIRERRLPEEQFAGERIPDWLASGAPAG
ncbi:diaminopimelate decarboxylase [Marinimicrococcus flavescens]|uniref:Diaminopimelate decarboxylase n=1 Tax=Marinimicrococcus flavescens TaxID=3031815 RepID=A0AAP3XSZ5_9PROT|nr:diaminopimelate decarboxylase [Marinimicrococcus flavescens]